MAKTQYVITKKFSKSSFILDFWVAPSKDRAVKHLKALFNVELLCAKAQGSPLPADCTDLDFFYVMRPDGRELRYSIETATAV